MPPAKKKKTAAAPAAGTSNMPPAKKKKKTAAAPAAGTSPYEVWFKEFGKVKKEMGGLGYAIIEGVKKEGNEEEDEEEEDTDTSVYTAEQMSELRVVIITPRRADMIEDVQNLLGCDEEMLMFTTSFSYKVESAIHEVMGTVSKQKDFAIKFDLLFTLTHILAEYDYWVHDHEVGWGGVAELKKLGKAWKTLLTKDDKALGIEQYSRAGTECMLRKFEEALGNTEDEAMGSFPWK